MDEAKNNDRLEQLAKEAAEGAQFEFNPSAWDAMEKKLDVPKKGFFWWKLGGGLSVLAIVILLMVLWPKDKNQIQEESKAAIEEKESRKNSKDEDLTTALENQNSKEGEAQKNDQGISTLDDISPKASANNETEVDPKNRTLSSSQASNLKPSSDPKIQSLNQSSESKNNLTTIDPNSKVLDQANSIMRNTPEMSYFEPSQPKGLIDSTGNQIADLDEIGMETITPRYVPGAYRFDQSLQPMTLGTSYYQTADLDSLQTFKRWSLGVLVSLDLSATGLEGFTKPGTMVGLQAEYRLSSKWSIQSGLSYSVKNYAALGQEYNTSSWLGGRSSNLLSALARCLVLDIPLNIRRYFPAKNGNQWFVSSGVSTYLMLQEDYTYEYAIQNPNWAPTGQVRGENNHLFGIANFSAGYQTSLTKKLNIAIEPFMKLPLTGIGAGRVKFLSFGINTAITINK